MLLEATLIVLGWLAISIVASLALGWWFWKHERGNGE